MGMGSRRLLLLAFVVCSPFLMMGKEVHAMRPRHVQKMFVFGDSYVDNGNTGSHFNYVNSTRSWRFPYGETFPRRPTGRYSDGRVFSDFMASFLGIKSPMPYKYRNILSPDRFFYGMNFAHGGAGVFDTDYHQPTLSQQIDQFQEQINDGLFTRCDLGSSLALVSISGNDYSTFVEKNPSGDLISFMDVVVGEMTKSLKRLRDMGVGRVAVMNIAPLGCTPYATYNTSHKECDVFDNAGAGVHNGKLVDALNGLNNSRSAGDSRFFCVDVNAAFDSVINGKGSRVLFKDPLQPCCEAFDNENGHCGDVDEKGARLYKLCEDPTVMFFWDAVHPTQAGWGAVFDALRPSLAALL